jgi:hypothetical protein
MQVCRRQHGRIIVLLSDDGEMLFRTIRQYSQSNAADTLREIGRAYLANASDVSSAFDARPLALVARRLLG